MCGRLFPNTSHGRAEPLDSCSLCREEVAGVVRRERDGNEFALTGSVAGLITQSLNLSVHGGSVTVPLMLTARLATAGFWLIQASQLWERGLTRASGEATCFLGNKK